MAAPLSIWTDGSSLGNPGPGGWAFYVPDIPHQESGGEPLTTNNRMELMALAQALSWAKFHTSGKLILWTDSQWAMNCANRLWHPKEHLDLFEPVWGLLDTLRSSRDVLLIHVRAHADSPQNNMADRLAHQEAQRQKELAARR